MDGVPLAEPTQPPAVSAVPRRMRQLCTAVAAVVIAVMAFVALVLKSSSTGVMRFQTSDQIAMLGIGLALGAGIVLLGRSRVDADATGVRVRNIAGGRELPWALVRAVRFDRKSPWASLLLSNGDELAVLAVQAVDGERAVRAVEGLRALQAAAREPEAPKLPLLYDD
jgi:PH (Pleckstrin Homology) domain-containing protein